MEQKLYNALKELLKEYDQHIPEDCTCEKALLAAKTPAPYSMKFATA